MRFFLFKYITVRPENQSFKHI
uniref:Uncharacterized protein n=1 Tax=Anguilla anguilla TaxID=7936 RepID=A0A0E9U754_ANGAN